jgi:hypothetical protein
MLNGETLSGNKLNTEYSIQSHFPNKQYFEVYYSSSIHYLNFKNIMC